MSAGPYILCEPSGADWPFSRPEFLFADALIQNSRDGVIVFDTEFRYTVWNPAMERLTGISAEHVLGRCAFEVLPFLKETGEEAFFEAALQGRTSFSHERAFVVPETGRSGFFEATYWPVRETDGRIVGGCAMVRDITERKRREEIEQRLEAEHRIAHALAEAQSLEEAAPEILSVVCRIAHAQIAELWLVDDSGEALRCAALWSPTRPRECRAFIAQSRHLALRSGCGLPGRVWSTRRPAQIADLHLDHNFPRAKAAREARLRSGCAFPIATGTTFYGVIDFFTRERFDPPGPFLEMMTAIGQDIAQFARRRRAEAEVKRLNRALASRIADLETSNERLSLALKAARMGIWTRELDDTNRVEWSSELEEIFGLPAGSFAGTEDTFWEFVHPDDRPLLQRAIERAIAEQQEFEAEFRFSPRQGGTRWMHTRGRATYDEAGKPVRLAGIGMDVTDRKRATLHSHAFGELGRQLNSARTAREAARIMANAADQLFGWDAFSFDLYHAATDAIQPILSIDVVGGSRQEVTSSCGSKPPTIIVRHVIDGQKQLILRTPPIAMTPELIPFGDRERPSASIMLVPVRNNEQTIGVLSIQNYTVNAYDAVGLEMLQAMADYCGGALERIRAEEALRASEAHFRNLAEAIPNMVWTTTPSGEFDYCNRRWTQYTGQSPAESRGTGWLKAVHPEHLERASEAWQRSLATNELYEAEFLLRAGDGSFRWHINRALPLKSPEGRVIKWFGTCTDIHEKKMAAEIFRQMNQVLEQRVEERTRALREINDQMEAFCYTVSHDLRAPLRAVRAFSQMLLDDYAPRLDEAGQDFLKRVASGAQRMDQLIQDLLEYSRLGRMEVTLAPVSVERAVRTVLLDLRTEIRAREAVIDVAPELGMVIGHATVLDQILQNLLSNALKFVSPGVTPQIRIHTENCGEISRIWVEDNGIGIPPEYQSRIFRVFERLHGNDAYPGTGIGLAIVQKAAERMNGRVGVDSQPGKGSRFWVELPVACEG